MSKKLRVFETFAGIGAQNRALAKLLKENDEFKYEVVATSEWDIDAIIAYSAINNLSFNKEMRGGI